MVRFSLSTLVSLLIATITASAASVALASPNDITLQRFGTCVPNSAGAPCASVDVNEAAFRSFARELGVATAIVGMQPAETLGQSGFALSLEYASTSITNDADYWQLGAANGDPAATRPYTQLRFRKGLPFSMEIGGYAGFAPGTDLYAFGGEFKFALLEDTLWPAPDIAIRGWGGAVLGNRDLNLYHFGFDAIVSHTFGLGDVVQLSPFVGYSLLVVYSGSRLMNAAPGDGRPPIQNPSNPALNHAPEYVFGMDNELVHRMFAGMRLSFAALDLTVQGAFLGDQTTVSFGGGFSF